jgi:hypothetical protein
MKSSTVVLTLALFGASAFGADPRELTSEQRMFADALLLERQGKGAEAVRAYEQAARAGSGKAARRLAEIYDRGIPGVSRDYAESLKWENAARMLGEDAERAAAGARRWAQEDAIRREEAKREEGARLIPPVLRWKTGPAGASELYEQAAKLEQAGREREAVTAYKRAAREGSGKAARRLSEIYDKGLGDVPRDYAESLKWANAARTLGEDMPPPRR